MRAELRSAGRPASRQRQFAGPRDVSVLVAGGEHHHGGARTARQMPQLLDQLESIHFRHVSIG
jgi:hypothetical protein